MASIYPADISLYKEVVLMLTYLKSQALHARAMLYYQGSSYEKALADFNTCLNLKPYSNGYYWRGCTYFYLGRYQEALTDLGRVEPNTYSAKYYLYKAQIYAQLERYVEAEKNFMLADAHGIERDSNSSIIYAKTLYYLKSYSRAYKVISEIQSNLFTEHSDEYYLLNAKILFVLRVGNINMFDYLNKVVKHDNLDYFIHATLCHKLSKYTLAYFFLKRIRDSWKKKEYYVLASQVFYKLGHYGEAKQALNWLAQKNTELSVPECNNILNSLEYSQLSDNADREIFYTQQLETFDYFLLRGKINFRFQLYQKALNDFNNIYRHDILDKDFYYCRGLAYYYLNKKKEALNDLVLGSPHDDYDNFYLIRAKLYAHFEEYDKALNNLNGAKVLDQSSHDEICILRARCYQKLQDYAGVLDSLRTVNNKELIYYQLYAQASFYLNNYDSLLPILKYLLSLPSDNILSHNEIRLMRSQVFYKTKQYNNALIDLNNTLSSTHSVQTNILKLRSKIYYHLGDFKKMYQDLNVLIAKDNRNNHYRWLAKAQFYLKRYQEALKTLKKSINQYYTAKDYYWLGRIHYQLNQFSQSAKHFKSAFINKQSSNHYYWLGKSIFKRDKGFQNIHPEFIKLLNTKVNLTSANHSNKSKYSYDSNDKGSYEFSDIILKWSPENIEEPVDNLVYLPKKFNNIDSYFYSFLNLILEESREILNTGLQKKPKTISANLIKLNFSRGLEKPSKLIFSISTQCNELKDIKPGTALLLSEHNLQRNYFAIVSYKNAPSFEVKMIMKKDDRDYMHDKNAQYIKSTHQKNWQWSIQILGSIITQKRMFVACYNGFHSKLSRQLANGRIISATNQRIPQLNGMSNVKERLNPSQFDAIAKFLKLRHGIQFIQGPPGTGKTTTITSLIQLLCEQGHRIFVSAPSNKAVQVLAQRLSHLDNSFSMILAGVEDKLPKNSPFLKKIFLHTWLETTLTHLSALEQSFWKMPEPSINSNLSKSLERISKNYFNLISFISKYELINEAICNDYLDDIDNTSAFLNNPIKTPDSQKAFCSLLGKITQNIYHITQAFQKTDQGALEPVLLNQANIIFATLSISGRTSFKKTNPVDIVIVDEAGQSVEAETLIPLYLKPKKILFIGDTKQLPATVLSPAAKKNGYERSLMTRMLEDNKNSASMLTIQYRMHSEIRKWPSKRYYGDLLSDAGCIAQRPITASQQLFFGSYTFINVQSKEKKCQTSRFNATEAKRITAAVSYLKENNINVNKKVGIITFYSAQVDHIKNEMAKHGLHAVSVQSVDGFQGDERDIIFISFVRANPQGTVGFLSDFRRLNVALTRARHQLIMFGHIETLQKHNPDLQSLISDAKNRKKIIQESQFLKLCHSPSLKK